MFSIDGVEFPNTKIEHVIRAVRIESGGNGFVSFNGRIHTDHIGRYIDYTVSIKQFPFVASEYDSLFEMLSRAGEHSVSGLPYGQGEISGTYTFSSLTDESVPDEGAGLRIWGNMQVSLMAVEPYA